MAYYLTIANKGEYKKLNLLLLEGFIKTSKFKGEALSLDELDDLTSKYQDEYEFKKKLYQAGIISIDEITKELSIRRKQNNNLIKVKYGLIYQKESKYLDQLYLRSILISKQRDYTFLEKLSLLKENLIKENQKETLGSYRVRKLTKDYTVDGQMSLFNN